MLLQCYYNLCLEFLFIHRYSSFGVILDDDTRLLRHPLTSFCRPYALAWAATMTRLRLTTYTYLFTRVLPLATVFQGFNAFSGLRLLYCVIPTAFKHIYVMHFLYSRGLVVICTAMLHFACLH